MSVVNKLILKLTLVTLLIFVSACLPSQSVSAKGNQSSNFKWIYRYDHTTQIGKLHVYLLDRATCQEKSEVVFTSMCVDNGDHVACEVDIQERINEMLDDAGEKDSAPAVDYYPSIYAEVTGTFDKSHATVDDSVIGHPSIDFDIEASQKHASARFSTQWANTASASNAFSITKGTQTMLATYGANRFHHIGNATHIDTQYVGVGAIPFQLDQTTFRFYNLPGFQLETAEIDPSKCGWG